MKCSEIPIRHILIVAGKIRPILRRAVCRGLEEWIKIGKSNRALEARRNCRAKEQRRK